MKLDTAISAVLFSGLAFVALGRAAAQSSPLCPDIIRNSCPTLACNPIVINTFYCCSGGTSPAGNPKCCNYTCKRIECFEGLEEGLYCPLTFPPATNAKEGTPQIPAVCQSLPTYQYCLDVSEP